MPTRVHPDRQGAIRQRMNDAAPGPVTSILENEVSSKMAARSRHARCSAAMAGDQISPAHPRGRSDGSPSSAFRSNQLTRSQPDFSPHTAPSSWSRG